MYGQGKFVFTRQLLFLSSCNDHLKPPRHLTSSMAQDVLHTSVFFSVSEPLVHVGSLTLSCRKGSHSSVCIKKFFLANLAHVYLVIRPARRTSRAEESLFSPPHLSDTGLDFQHDPGHLSSALWFSVSF